MATITNEKIASLKPRWSPFRGFSLLFDNPGSNLTMMENSKQLYQITCDPKDPHINFYYELSKIGHHLEELKKEYLFCPLPFSSYHVTAWDGLNDFNVHQVNEKYRSEVHQLLNKNVEQFLDESEFYSTAEGKPIAIQLEHPLQFKFKKLNCSRNTVVVRLQPADAEAERHFEEVVMQRDQLQKDFKNRFGFKPASEQFRPHITLGYFANKDRAANAKADVALLEGRLWQQLSGVVVSFSSISLYGMTDMETFFKKIN